ncbi:claudin-8-like [Eublepharis macularius]|uniref:Claudin-8-like n=1 Tax=Eublepharis macularius TaxID=481883 RepID=A0AA97J4G9_EUBMA|nr:claudin-8-like [Eublepharis macularius]
MACFALETLGLLLGIIGAFGTFAVTLTPQWKVTANIGGNILISEIHWEGLWMSCIRRMGGTLVCLNHLSPLALETYLGVSRALMCTACVLSVIAFLIAVPGMKCFKYLGNNEKIKSKILLTAGIIFILTGIIVLIPISWFTNNIIKDFYDKAIPDTQKYELGEAIYLGWVTPAFLIPGGGILCSFCRHAKKSKGYSSPSSDRVHKLEHVMRKPSSAHSYV